MFPVMEQIIMHLEFLGYEITRNGERTVAKHPSKFNIALLPLAGGILLTSIFGGNENAQRDKFGYLEMINTLNAKAVIARFYADEDLDLFMEAWYPNYYDRTEFGAFLETWDRDCMILATSQAREYLR